MKPCIVVKGKQYQHQFICSSDPTGVHCHFCQLSYPNREAAENDMKFEQQIENTRWPEGAEL